MKATVYMLGKPEGSRSREKKGVPLEKFAGHNWLKILLEKVVPLTAHPEFRPWLPSVATGQVPKKYNAKVKVTVRFTKNIVRVSMHTYMTICRSSTNRSRRLEMGCCQGTLRFK